MNDILVLPDHAKVWVYQNTAAIDEAIIPAINEALKQFTANWKSHNHALNAVGMVLHNRFVVLGVDEENEAASGCSIDTSVHFIKQLERDFKLDLFNRMYFSYQLDGKVSTVDQQTFSKRYKDGIINDDTLVFDTMVKNYGQLQREFAKPLGVSWHRRMV